MTQREIDPEVAADLRRREDSERDKGRRRELARVLPDPVIDHWPCRTGCGAMVGMTPTGISAWRENNATMATMGMSPNTKAEVMWCPSCKAADEQRIADERAQALLPRQTEIPATTNDLARYLPTPRKGKRPF